MEESEKEGADGQYIYKTYALAKIYCCEAEMYYQTMGIPSAVFKFCEKHKQSDSAMKERSV